MRHNASLAPFGLFLALLAGGPAWAEDAPATEPPADEPAAAEEEPAPWSCSTCPYVFGWQGEWGADLGIATGATDWSSRAWPYEDGANLGLAADVMRLDEDGTRVDVVVRGLGLDDSSVVVGIGKAGTYEAGFDWWTKRWATAEGPQTPFEGVGSGALTVPAGWVRGDATTDMTQLATALHGYDMATDRERIGAHGTWWSRNGWETSLEARIDTRSGVDAISGSFLTRSTLLPEPIDYTTESLVASATYGAKNWDVQLRYLLSTFDSGATALLWDNPFLGLHPTADQGQMALAPDNDFQQFAVDARYRTQGGIRLEAGAALGMGEQDATLLPATANPGLATVLPRNSAAAEVDTQLLYARAAVPFDNGLMVRGEVRYDSRDPGTPQDSWTQVVTDTYIAAARTNVAYGHERTRIKVEGDWVLGGVRLLGRLQNLSVDRDQEAVAETSEDQLALEAHGMLGETIDWGVELIHDVRDGSAYAAPIGPSPDNPAMRIYTYADMERDRVALTVGASPVPELSLAFRVERTAEDYDETQIGLTDRKDTGVGLDATYAIGEDMSVAAFYQRQTLASDQAGSSAYAAPDWSARSEDATEALGITFVAPYVMEKLGLRADFNLTETTGLVTVDPGITDAFPETLSKLRQFVVMADYRWSERITWRFGIRIEDLATADWALAGVAPDTVSNLLWSGQVEPDYELQVLELGVRVGL